MSKERSGSPVISFNFVLADGQSLAGSYFFHSVTRKVDIRTEDGQPVEPDIDLTGQLLKLGAPESNFRLYAVGNEWHAAPEGVFQAMQIAKREGFEVVKDVETDYYRWRAIHWAEESGLFDTDDEAWLGCVSQNDLE